MTIGIQPLSALLYTSELILKGVAKDVSAVGGGRALGSDGIGNTSNRDNGGKVSRTDGVNVGCVSE